ncbi:Sec34-like family protein [Ostertagia ostertagi]
MAELRTSYASVTARTSSLHDACDRALAYQTALAAGAEQIRTNLHFFKQADIIMKKLNNTTKISVTGQMFTGILATIDECLTFLRQHPEYKESAAYIVKYEQCLSRAMTWIRVGVMADIEASVNDVRDRQSQLQVDYAKLGRGGADDDTFALLYGVFATRANSVKAALSVAEQRFAQVPELQAMLAECQQAYFNTRQQLLTPIIQATLAHMFSNTYADSSCALTRNSCAFILGLCDDEFPSLSAVLLNGPGVRRSTVSFRSTEQAKSVSGGRARTATCLIPSIILKSYIRQFGGCCYEAVLYGQTDIAGYKPAAGDLAYPEKLEMMRRGLRWAKKGERMKKRETAGGTMDGRLKNRFLNLNSNMRKNSSSARPSPAPISAVDLHCLWYPTVRRTVMCLAKLYRCLDVAVFQSLARDLLTMLHVPGGGSSTHCCGTIQKEDIFFQTGHTKKLDGELFLVKHLLILREQTAPYRQAAHRILLWPQMLNCHLATLDVVHRFCVANEELYLRMNKSRWFELSSNNAFELLFSVPIHVSEQSSDTRRVIDLQLRTRCNQLIATSAEFIVGPLLKWVDTAEDELLKPDFDLKKHPDLAPSKLNDLSKVAVKALSHAWPEVRLNHVE